jgi:ferritin
MGFIRYVFVDLSLTLPPPGLAGKSCAAWRDSRWPRRINDPGRFGPNYDGYCTGKVSDMALSQALNAKLNEQITNEFYASQLYLAMACMFESMSLKMLARRFRKQVEEERGHALKILDYILEVEGQVLLQGLPQPTHEWPSVLAATEAALAHEKKVTGQIRDLVALAEQEKDYATRSFLQWYVNEQVEEEATATYQRDVAKMAGPQLLQLEHIAVQMMKE